MAWGRWVRLAATGCAFGLACIVVYQGARVWRAEARSEIILHKAMTAAQPLRISQLTPQQKSILLAVEDPSFYEHNGIDVSAPGQGMTTITQGLVKLLYFKAFKPGFAKIEQSLIAWLVLDRRLGKDEQLSLFLNIAYLGHVNGQAVRGFSDGAQVYFGKVFAELSEVEYIGLVGMLIGPNRLNPVRHAAAFNERVRRIRKLLAGECRPNGVFDPWYEGCARLG